MGEFMMARFLTIGYGHRYP